VTLHCNRLHRSKLNTEAEQQEANLHFVVIANMQIGAVGDGA